MTSTVMHSYFRGKSANDDIGGNIVTAKEYLDRIGTIDLIIRQKVKEKKDMRERLSLTGVNGINYSKELTNGAATGEAPFVRLTDNIMEHEKVIDSEIRGLLKERHDIINMINDLKNRKYSAVLYGCYVEHKELSIVAGEMGYSYQYVLALHSSALRKFSEEYEVYLQ